MKFLITITTPAGTANAWCVSAAEGYLIMDVLGRCASFLGSDGLESATLHETTKAGVIVKLLMQIG